jgi:hypothetical protein
MREETVTCPHAKAFKKTVNMSAAQIRAWRRKRKKECRSIRKRSNGRSAVDELDMVAKMLKKPASKWTKSECKKARDLVNFVKRHRAGRGSVCSHKRLIALRDWAHHPKRCKKPANACKTVRGKG